MNTIFNMTDCAKQPRKAKTLCLLTLLTLTALSVSTLSFAEESENRFIVGLGLGYESAIYQGVDGYAYPAPLFDIRWGRFFVYGMREGSEGVMAGVQVFETENTSLSLMINQGTTFLDIDDVSDESADLFTSLEDRKAAIEYGFRYLYNSPVGRITWDYYKDFGSAYDGMRNTLRIARTIGRPDRLQFRASLYVDYFSTAFNDYYYGITAEENEEAAIELDLPLNVFEEQFRPQWDGQNSGHLGIDLKVEKPYSENLIGTFYFALEEVLGEVYRSAIVEDKERFYGAIGVLYKF